MLIDIIDHNGAWYSVNTSMIVMIAQAVGMGTMEKTAYIITLVGGEKIVTTGRYVDMIRAAMHEVAGA